MSELQFLAAFGGYSRPSLDWAARWAVATGARLDIMFAIRPTPGTTKPPEPKRAAAQTSLDNEVARLRKAFPGLQVNAILAYRKPVAALVAASRDYAAIVVGTKGTGGWEGLKVGSVAGTVSASAECPVVVVPDHAELHSENAPIAIGFNGTPEAYGAVSVMLRRAQNMGIGVIILDVRLTDEEREPEDPIPDSGEMQSLLRDVVNQFPDVEVEYRQRTEDPAKALADVTDEARLTVMTTRGHGGVGGFLLGETTARLLQMAKGPVNIRTSTRLGQDDDLGVLPN